MKRLEFTLEYWVILVSPTKHYEIRACISRPDLNVQRADHAEARYIQYEGLDGFEEMKKNTTPLGFTIERLSPFNLVVREIKDKQRSFNIHVEYEKIGQDDSLFIPSFTFCDDEQLNVYCTRDEGRTVVQTSYNTRSASESRTKTFITSN